MGLGQWLACNVTPLLLRLGLAAVFIWAGYGKLAYNDPVSGEDAAILANMGVIKAATSTPAPKEPPAQEPAPAPAPAPEKPAETPDEVPAEKPADDGKPETRRMGESVILPALAQESAGAAQTMSPAPAAFTAEDFPTPVMVGRVYKIALVLHRAAYPADPADQLWPTQLAEPKTIKTLSWLAAVTEVAGGALMLFGFMTRLAALGLAGTMCVAMLLTTIGPAAVSGTGFLGFLPPPRMNDPDGWGMAWQGMLFQWALLTMALGVMFSGPGGLSLDRLIFGRQKSKPAAPAKSD